MKHRQQSMGNTTTGKFLLTTRQGHFRTLTVLILTLSGLFYIGCKEEEGRQAKKEAPKLTTQVIWPEVITNTEYEYVGENIRERAIADGLSAWGCSRMEKPPDNFGEGMLKIGIILDCVATPEKLMELSDEIIHPDKVR